jgi:hypothetical protein
VFFTVALPVGVAGIVVAQAHGDREGGAPGVVFAHQLENVDPCKPDCKTRATWHKEEE